MTWGICAPLRRSAMAGLLVAIAAAPLACASLWGIDDGSPKGDASGDDAIVSPDVETHPPTDGGVAPADAGQEEDGAVACVLKDGWCKGRCAQTSDNCGNPINCGECDGGVACTGNACGCLPESASVTCAGRQCGEAINNCQLAVNCGVNGTTACASGSVCLPDADTCCTPPDNATACGTKCQTSVVTQCGTTVACPASCPNSQPCVQNQCCVPAGCSGACIDTCGDYSLTCCPKADAAPPADAGCVSAGCAGACMDTCGQYSLGCCPKADAGVPPLDGSSCSGSAAVCVSSAQCCSARCSYSGYCVPMCGLNGGPCSASTDCCYGLTCRSGTVQSAGIDGGVVYSQGMCAP